MGIVGLGGLRIDDVTKKQEEKIYNAAVKYFEKNYTDDYWHFANYDGYIKNTYSDYIYEVYSSKGGFYIIVPLNYKNKYPIAKKIRAIKI